MERVLPSAIRSGRIRQPSVGTTKARCCWYVRRNGHLQNFACYNNSKLNPKRSLLDKRTWCGPWKPEIGFFFLDR